MLFWLWAFSDFQSFHSVHKVKIHRERMLRVGEGENSPPIFLLKATEKYGPVDSRSHRKSVFHRTYHPFCPEFPHDEVKFCFRLQKV